MKKHITIFFGGIDSERAVSLKTVKTVEKYLDSSQYDIARVEVMEDRTWQRGGKQVGEEILQWTDYAFIAGHGTYMEDGELQKILDSHRVPYNGTDALSSKIAFSKSATKEIFSRYGIQTAVYETHMLDQNLEELAQTIFQSFPQPCVIKPDRGGSSCGVAIASTRAAIYDALTRVAILTDKVIVEEYITGKEATCGVVESMRDEDVYALPPVEIIPANEFFDYEAKYEGQVQEICPAGFSDELKSELQDLARKVHINLGLSDYSRTDFIIHEKKGIYLLEVNTLPDFTEKSDCLLYTSDAADD